MIYQKSWLFSLFLSSLLGITSININKAQATNVTFDFDSLPSAQNWTYISNDTSILETNLFSVAGIGSLFQEIDFWTISGWFLTFLGLLFGYWQWSRTKKLEKEQQEQMLVTIHFANYVSFEHEFIDEICPIIKDTIINRYLVSWHQAGCDLYKIQVRFYLSLLDKFTYDDLKSLCNTPMISYKWQKKYWMSLVSQRKENKGTKPPQDLLVLVNEQDSPSRFAYYKRNKYNTMIRSSTMELDQIKSKLVQVIKDKYPKLTDNMLNTILSIYYFGSFYNGIDFVENYLIEVLGITNYHTFQDGIDLQKIWEQMENKVITFDDGQKLHVIIDNIT